MFLMLSFLALISMKALLHKKSIILMTGYLEQRIFLEAFPTSKYSMSLCCCKI